VLRAFVQNGEYQKSLDELEKIKAYKKENTKLLYYLEKGLALHLQGKYEESLKALDAAKEIHKSLYTESISKKLEAFVINDSSDNYYGETYERSLIHFYLSLNHLLLYQKSQNQEVNQLFSSRAEVMAWDSYLKEQIGEKRGQIFFKNDLMAKVYGALIHEMISSREDNQIALHLYQDAKDLLFRNYNSYPSFNRKFREFNENFKKLPDMNEEEIRKRWVEETIYQRELKKFLASKISNLTKELKRGSNKNTPENSSISILLERGIIPQKQAKEIYFPLSSFLYANPNDSISINVNNYGSDDIFQYAQNNLGFKRMPSDYTYVGENGYSTRNPFSSDLAINFEVPVLKSNSHEEKMELAIFDNKGKEIKKENLFLISPIGDIAQNALEENEPARNLRIGLRLASKYLAVIVSSYATYNALKKSTSPGLASFLALTEFYLATKVIESLEKADLRFWSTLPQNIYFSNIQLPSGNYQIKLNIENLKTGELNTRTLGDLKVDNNQNKKIAKFRIPD
jgi:hypothetical protein